jgi:hypothetical protein
MTIGCAIVIKKYNVSSRMPACMSNQFRKLQTKSSKTRNLRVRKVAILPIKFGLFFQTSDWEVDQSLHAERSTNSSSAFICLWAVLT